MSNFCGIYTMRLEQSWLRGKKYAAIFKNGKVVHFGAAGYEDYTIHRDKIRRDRYIARHNNGRENWNDPYSPGALSRWILWGDSTSINVCLREFNKKFQV
jgi:hypothetical protein